MHRLVTENKNALIVAMRCLYAKCPFLYEHSILTANIARELVVQTKIDFRLSDVEAYEAGILHDIGKIAVNDSILNKNTTLSQREMEIIKRHPLWGSDQVKNTVFDKYSDIILKHHEQIDGTGYPLGINISDDDVHIKLVMFSDELSAYLENRPYRRTTYNEKMLIVEIERIAQNIFTDEHHLSEVVRASTKIASIWHKKTNVFDKFEKLLLNDVVIDIGKSMPPTLSVMKTATK